MKILTAEQVRNWDQFTIANEPVSSVDLIERASTRVVEWLLLHKSFVECFAIFCGPGNNGGDGLAVARLLLAQKKQVQVFIFPGKTSADFTTNLQRLQKQKIQAVLIETATHFPELDADTLIVDALFGTGINRPMEGLPAALVKHINGLPNQVVSIDLPSGLIADAPTTGDSIIRASHTLTFQTPKLAMFFAENDMYAGKWEVLDIGLHTSFAPESNYEWVLENSPWLHLKKYPKHAHKGLLGHAMIAAGSRQKMGAAVMAARGCLHSGAGLLTMAVPDDCFGIIQTVTPEAMCRPLEESANEFFLQQAKINAVGAGPGWNESEDMYALLEELIVTVKCPLVLDATALFHLAKNPSLLLLRPKGSETIITPHIGEFARLFGPSANSFQRMATAIDSAKTYNLFIVLKGAFTQIITPGGMCYFNSSGNPGMAKGGSGDVLTGVLTSLLAQRYPATLACVLAVYAHGLAGDLAAAEKSTQGMTAMDIIDSLPQVWKKLAL